MKEHHVCYCVDKGFEKYTLASIISLFLNSNLNLKIHIIHNKFTNLKKIKIAEKLFLKNFEYYLVDDKSFKGFLTLSGAYSTYYRLFISKVLSKRIDKVLYLDCDTIIEGSLKGIFSINLNNYFLSAVEDSTIIVSNFKDMRKRLNLTKKKSYFNAGVLLFNLKLCRKKDFFNKAISFVKKNKKNIVLHDQDCLNGIVSGKWLKLPSTYNYIITEGIIFNQVKNHKIIHFAGLKPEMIRLIRPNNYYCNKYYDYLAMTNLKDDEIKKVELNKLVRRVYKTIIK